MRRFSLDNELLCLFKRLSCEEILSKHEAGDLEVLQIDRIRVFMILCFSVN